MGENEVRRSPASAGRRWRARSAVAQRLVEGHATHVGQPFDSDLAPLGLRSWRAIRQWERLVIPVGLRARSEANALSWSKGSPDLSFLPMFNEVIPPESVAGFAFLYILETVDGTFYVGHSRNVRKRLRKHHYGLGSKHTRDHPKGALVYVEGPLDPSEAVRRERQIKGWSRAKKIALLSGDINRLKALARPLRRTETFNSTPKACEPNAKPQS